MKKRVLLNKRSITHYLFVITLLLCFQPVSAQKILQLTALESGSTQAKVHGIMYGMFIQRLAFSSGGFPQDIIILNTDTKKYYKFPVKPTFKSAKNNLFCNYIAPGNYTILSYNYTQSKWYGGMMYSEPVSAYRFTIEPGKIHYLGTWNFSEKVPAFTNNKDSVTTVVQKKFKKIDFSAALITVPE